VNGKLRDTLTAPKGAPREALEEMALASEKVVRDTGRQGARKVIVVPIVW
jgi:leucyl-tRNA synthetase